MLLSTKHSHCSDTLLPHNATHINNRSIDNHPADIVSLESCFQLYRKKDDENYSRLIAAISVINIKYAVVPAILRKGFMVYFLFCLSFMFFLLIFCFRF